MQPLKQPLKVNEVDERLKIYSGYYTYMGGFLNPKPLDEVIRFPEFINSKIEDMYDKIELTDSTEFSKQVMRKLNANEKEVDNSKVIEKLVNEYFYNKKQITKIEEFDAQLLIDYYNNYHKILKVLEKNEKEAQRKWESLLNKDIDSFDYDTKLQRLRVKSNTLLLADIVMWTNRYVVSNFCKIYNMVDYVLGITFCIR